MNCLNLKKPREIIELKNKEDIVKNVNDLITAVYNLKTINARETEIIKNYVTEKGNAIDVQISYDNELQRYIVPKTGLTANGNGINLINTTIWFYLKKDGEDCVKRGYNLEKNKLTMTLNNNEIELMRERLTDFISFLVGTY